MVAKGISIIYEATVSQVQSTENCYNVVLTNGQTICADRVMLATGRVPNTTGLGLERAGIKVNEFGAVVVDEKMTTNVSHIWAVGDVTGHIQLTPVAIHDAMCFVKNAFENTSTPPDYDLITTAVFHSPKLELLVFQKKMHSIVISVSRFIVQFFVLCAMFFPGVRKKCL